MRKTVVERENNQCAKSAGNGHQRQCLLDVGRIIPVSEHHSFGIGRCARCIADSGNIIRSDGFIPFSYDFRCFI